MIHSNPCTRCRRGKPSPGVRELAEEELARLGIYMDPFHPGRAFAILNRLAPGWRSHIVPTCPGVPMTCPLGILREVD